MVGSPSGGSQVVLYFSRQVGYPIFKELIFQQVSHCSADKIAEVGGLRDRTRCISPFWHVGTCWGMIQTVLPAPGPVVPVPGPGPPPTAPPYRRALHLKKRTKVVSYTLDLTQKLFPLGFLATHLLFIHTPFSLFHGHGPTRFYTSPSYVCHDEK